MDPPSHNHGNHRIISTLLVIAQPTADDWRGRVRVHRNLPDVNLARARVRSSRRDLRGSREAVARDDDAGRCGGAARRARAQPGAGDFARSAPHAAAPTNKCERRLIRKCRRVFINASRLVSGSVIAEKSIVKPACLRRSSPAFPIQHSPPIPPMRCNLMIAGRSSTSAGPIPTINSGISSESNVCVPPTPVMSVVPLFAL
jgi:hypothetical protein